jgi:quinol monooxygenase YgiN
MIIEYLRYEIGSERTDEFLGAYERGAESLRASPHCLGYELSRCQEEPSSFILRIHWDSIEGHLQGFRKSPEFKPFLAAVQPFIPAIREMRHYEKTALDWAR